MDYTLDIRLLWKNEKVEVEKNMPRQPGHRKEILQSRLGYLAITYHDIVRLLYRYEALMQLQRSEEHKRRGSEPITTLDARVTWYLRLSFKQAREGRMVYVFIGGWGLGFTDLTKRWRCLKIDSLVLHIFGCMCDLNKHKAHMYGY